MPCAADPTAALQTNWPLSARSTFTVPSRSTLTAYPSATTGLASVRAAVAGVNDHRPSAKRAPERSADSRVRPASSPSVDQSSACAATAGSVASNIATMAARAGLAPPLPILCRLRSLTNHLAAVGSVTRSK